MRSSRFVVTLILIGLSATFVLADTQEDEKFAKLVDAYLEYTWQNSPLQATENGIHTYDDQIESLSVEHARHQFEKDKTFVERFRKEINRSRLNETNQIDYDLILNSIKNEDFSLNRSHGLERNPSIYPEVIAGIGFLTFSREYAPFAERMDNLAKRLEKMPQILEEGEKNLVNPPKLWTQIAIEATKGAIGLYQQVIGPAARQLPEDSKKRLQSASANLVTVLQTYQDFLQKDLLPRSTGDFADGRENFVYRLRNFYMLDQSPEEIKAMAREVLEKTKGDMDTLARKVDPNKRWWEILDEAKKKHFTAEEVLPAYQKTTERARQWVIDKKLASIPEEKLQVIETPMFLRFVVPYAEYIRPAPFEREQKGFYFVTPVDTSLPDQTKEGQLGELYIDIENTTVHEGYPGHHLQFIHQNRLSKIRRLNDTPLMSEGWGLYCERLADEYDFYSSPVDRLEAYRWLLVRAVRVIVDVGLHCEGMSFDDAVNFMVDTTKIERPAAESEIRRYTESPTQPLSYLMGMMMIRDLREHFRKVQGDQFSIQEFHDRLLSYGAIPLKIIRESMLKQSK